MIDPNWFYSALAQSAAAIVGLIGAFVTSRVMMMASERSRIEKRINEINAEIKALKRQDMPLSDYINEVDRKDNEDTINDFLQAKRPELNLENLPTVEELLKELLEEESIEKVNEEFNTMFKEKYKVLIENIRTEKGNVAFPSQYLSLSVPSFIPNKHKYDRYNEYKGRVEKNDTEINYKDAKIQELQQQVSQIILPEHFKGLIFALIYFTIVGVILPLWLLPITPEQHLVWKPIVLVFFITGLFAVFLYIFIEIKHITKKPKIARTAEETPRSGNGKR